MLWDEFVGHGSGAVVDRDPIPVVGHVEDEVLSHDPESDKADIAQARRSFDWHCGMMMRGGRISKLKQRKIICFTVRHSPLCSDELE